MPCRRGRRRRAPRGSAPTWPSIIPLGPSRCAPASACATAISRVDGERRVVVDAAVVVEHAAVAVVGELVEAEVGHDDGGVADLGPHVAQGDVEHAVRVDACGAGGVAALGDAEEHQPADPRRHGLDGGLAQGVAGVLHDTGHRGDRHRLGGALLHEHRQHELARAQGGLGDEPPHRRRGAQPAGPVGREGHPPSVRGSEVLLQVRSVESSPCRRIRTSSMSASRWFQPA